MYCKTLQLILQFGISFIHELIIYRTFINYYKQNFYYDKHINQHKCSMKRVHKTVLLAKYPDLFCLENCQRLIMICFPIIINNNYN